MTIEAQGQLSTIKRWAHGIILWLIATVAIAQQTPERLLENGISAFESGLYQVAAEGFRTLLKTAPGSREAVVASFLEALSLFYEAGSGNKKIDAYALARNRFVNHQRRFPKSPYSDQIWYWIGVSRLAERDSLLALKAIERHLDQSTDVPFQLPALEAQARALEQLGRLDEALEQYQSLLRHFSEVVLSSVRVSWIERSGMLLLEQEEYLLAIEQFARIIADYPESSYVATAIFFIAEANYFAGVEDDSLNGYYLYLKSFPNGIYQDASLYRLARLLLDKEDFSAAYEIVLKINVENYYTDQSEDEFKLGPSIEITKVALLVGDIYAANNRWELAIESYEKGLALAVEPRHRQVLALNLGLALAEASRWKESIVNFEEALSGPDSDLSEIALYNRALLLVQDQQLFESVEALEQFVKRFPDSRMIPDVDMLLLETKKRLGNHQGIVNTLERIAGVRRLTPQEEHLQGLALLSLGQEISALHVLAQNGENLPVAVRAESLYLIGALYSRRGEYVRAASFLDEVRGERSAEIELQQRATYALAVTYFNTGQYEEALELLEHLTAATDSPWLSVGLFARAATLYRMGQAIQAAKFFDEAAVVHSTKAKVTEESLREQVRSARSWQALALFRGGELQQARDLFRELAIDTTREPGLQWYRAGIASALLEDYSSANEELEMAMKLVPANDILRPVIHYELARSYLSGQNMTVADYWLDQLEENFPNHSLTAIGRLQKADLLRRLGQNNEAAIAYEESAIKVTESPGGDSLGIAELARFSAIQIWIGSGSPQAALSSIWTYLLNHPQGVRAAYVGEQLHAILRTAPSGLIEKYFHKTDRAPSVLSIPIKIAYAETIIESNPKIAGFQLRELLNETDSENTRSDVLLLLARTYEIEESWESATNVYRGLALSSDINISSKGALGIARVLDHSGKHGEAAVEYGTIAIRFKDHPKMSGEAWFRGAIAHRNAGNLKGTMLFLIRLHEDFPSSIWARQANNEFQEIRADS